MTDDRIWVQHPDVPGSVKQVRARKLPHLANAGWLRLTADEVKQLEAEQVKQRDAQRAPEKRPASKPADTKAAKGRASTDEETG